ncbi:MAG: hypothetical protein R8K49_04525 [Mariprofundaceae bacterium]
MIEFLQVFESVLFLAVAYKIIKSSPLLETAAFINGQSLEQKEVEVIAQPQTVKASQPVRSFATKSHSRFHHAGMTFAH